MNEISLDTAMGAVAYPVLVETEQGRTVLEPGPIHDGLGKVVAHLEDGREQRLLDVPMSRPIRQLAASLSSSRPLRAFVLGPVVVSSKFHPLKTVARFAPLAFATVVGIAVFVFSIADEAVPWMLRSLLILLAVTSGVFWWDAEKKSQRYRQWMVGPIQDDERTSLAELELPPLVEEADVDDVKAEYGKLLSDIVYRIEFPALFDPHEPTTKTFTLALLQWDNNEGLMTKDEMRDLAARVRASFQSAKANAERIGMRHFPTDAFDRANTALKAARLATDESTSQGERENALRQAVAILDELALYFLPSGAEARKAITGSAPLQLPGRRTS